MVGMGFKELCEINELGICGLSSGCWESQTLFHLPFVVNAQQRKIIFRKFIENQSIKGIFIPIRNVLLYSALS